MPHYFAEHPEAGSRRRAVEVTLPDVSFTMQTDRGVFSHGQLDTGTGLLLRAAPALPETGRFLDLGCGAGAIAITMAMRSPLAEVWAVDVNERARQLCVENAARLGLGGIHVASPDEVADTVRFDRIWSNPPIRIGKSALHDLLDRWLVRLHHDGEAVLVIQRHLGADSLHAWLAGRGHPVERVASRAGYRVLRIGAR